jgi:hypothetical protein
MGGPFEAKSKAAMCKGMYDDFIRWASEEWDNLDGAGYPAIKEHWIALRASEMAVEFRKGLREV